VGEKVGIKKQVPAGGIGPLKQLLSVLTDQFAASTPPVEEMIRFAVPELVIVTVGPVELVLTEVFPKVALG